LERKVGKVELTSKNLNEDVATERRGSEKKKKGLPSGSQIAHLGEKGVTYR